MEKYTDLTVDFAKRNNVRYIIKGVRSVKDYEYEREQAEINRMLCPEIETIMLYTSPDNASISSSMVSELKRFGKDITSFTCCN